MRCSRVSHNCSFDSVRLRAQVDDVKSAGKKKLRVEFIRNILAGRCCALILGLPSCDDGRGHLLVCCSLLSLRSFTGRLSRGALALFALRSSAAGVVWCGVVCCYEWSGVVWSGVVCRIRSSLYSSICTCMDLVWPAVSVSILALPCFTIRIFFFPFPFCVVRPVTVFLICCWC